MTAAAVVKDGAPARAPRKSSKKTTALVVAENPTAQPPAVVSESVTIMGMIERAASNPDADIDKMERLMVMLKEQQAQQAKQLYAKAMKTAQSLMPAITKNGRNAQTKSRYATLEDINEKAVPVYTEAGFSLSFNTFTSTEEYCVGVSGRVTHEAGHHEDFRIDVPVDNKGPNGTINKTQTHARASSISYGQRYLVKLIFNLNLGGEDDDGNGGTDQTSASTEPQKRTPLFYPDETFNANFPDWKTRIEAGRQTPERVIGLVESKGLPLTEDQKSKLRNVKGPK